MDKKYVERPKKFDQKKYNSEYQKNNYKRFNTVIKPELAERLNNYCDDLGISKAEFLKRAIDLMEKQKNSCQDKISNITSRAEENSNLSE